MSTRIRWWCQGGVFLVLWAWSAAAWADRSWVITPVEVNRGGHTEPLRDVISVGLGMRSDNTWPVITYMGPGTSQDVHAVMMTPAGWLERDLYHSTRWGVVDTAAGPAGHPGFITPDGTYAALEAGHWQMSHYGDPEPGFDYYWSLSYRGDNTPSVLYRGEQGLTLATQSGLSWTRESIEPVMPNVQSCALAYDSWNNPTIAYSTGSRIDAGYHYEGQWYFSPVVEGGCGFSVGSLAMVMGRGDMPWLAYAANHSMYYGTYDPQHDQWTTGLLGSMLDRWTFCLEADHRGGVGFAFTDQAGRLNYAYHGPEGWQEVSIVDVDGMNYHLGLTYDADNNPIIAYTNRMGDLCLAYDPLMVPEPAGLVLLGWAGAALLRKKSSGRHRNR